jgi:hypothetical protein
LTAVNQGANFVVRKYDSTLGDFVTQSAPIYANDQTANKNLDPVGGGADILAGSLYVQYNVNPELSGSGLYNPTGSFEIFERSSVGATVITGSQENPTFVVGNTFTIQASEANSVNLTSAATVTIGGTGTAADFVAAVSAANVPAVSAAITSAGTIAFTHNLGGVIVLDNVIGTPITSAGITTTTVGVRAGSGDLTGALILSNWIALEYSAGASAPSRDPSDGQYWFYSATDQVDIMIQSGTGWQGYRNVTVDTRGNDLTLTDPMGPIVSASEPLEQSDGTDLVYGDLWIDTSNLELYPVIKRWELVNNIAQWVTLDNTDQTTSNGVLFRDARWAPNGITNPITGSIPSIESLLTSDYLDLDAPDANLYPAGMLLFNTRRSGYNVKSFQVDYFNATTFSVDGWSGAATYSVDDLVLYNGIIYIAIASNTGIAPTNTSYWAPLQTNAWVTATGNKSDGSAKSWCRHSAQQSILLTH